jgi:DNA-binding response OmpR family regulator
MILDLIALTLEQSGYRTMKALSAEEALTLARETAEPDVLITDLELPGMSGFKLAAHFIRRHPLARILFISGSPMHTEFDIGGDVFPFPFLAKPFELQELRAAVEALSRNMKASGISRLYDEKTRSFAG